MGICLSCSYNKPQAASNTVRIVHLDGFVEDFDHPVHVNQLITSKPPKHFICTPAQLLCPLYKPLTPASMLEPGRLYFLLPFSTLEVDVSPVNLATLVKRLTEKANARRPERDRIPGSASPMRSPARSFGLDGFMGSSPGRSPNRIYGPEVGSLGAYKSQRSVQAWRPILDTIRERSFNRRSESDLQEKYPEKRK